MGVEGGWVEAIAKRETKSSGDSGKSNPATCFGCRNMNSRKNLG